MPVVFFCYLYGLFFHLELFDVGSNALWQLWKLIFGRWEFRKQI
jgi:hypothetical protein